MHDAKHHVYFAQSSLCEIEAKSIFKAHNQNYAELLVVQNIGFILICIC